MTTLAMIQTLVERSSKNAMKPLFEPPIDFVVIDEAHHSISKSYKKLHNICGAARYVGVTATPFRIDGQGLAQFGFDTVVLGPSTTDLIKGGYLVQPKCDIKEFIKTENVRVVQGEFVTNELSREARAVTMSIVQQFLQDSIIPSSKDVVQRHKTIFFAVDVQHSLELRDALVEVGIKAEHIGTATSPSERDDILNCFRTGNVEALTNCMIATEGFDAPSCSYIVLARPTKSKVLFMQMVCRGLRASPGKKNCLILDCGGLLAEHGLPTESSEFPLQGGVRKKGMAKLGRNNRSGTRKRETSLKKICTQFQNC